MTVGRFHWREYAMEGALLGAFMIAACCFATLLEHPASPLPARLPDPVLRRLLMGLAMGATAVTLVRSPWGQRTGAHLNPSLTLTYLRLGRVRPLDAAGYVGGQFLGGGLGVGAAALLLGPLVAHPAVHYVATRPGPAGEAAAFAAEAIISAVLMLVVLVVSNQPRWAHLTPWCCGALVATYIAVEAPLSGMSMNPARSLASALGTRDASSLWIYFTAPPLGMWIAAEVYLRVVGAARLLCAKLDHTNDTPCLFLCRWHQA